MDDRAVRVQKILSTLGICSRRKAEQMILDKRVKINGVIAGLGDKADILNDSLTLDDSPISQPAKQTKTYIAFNKPKACICAISDDRGRKTVLDYLSDVDKSIYPVGRLDYNTEGLLLLTNDGDFAYKMTHPKHRIRKVYEVTLKGEVTSSQVEKLNQPMLIDGYKTIPSKVRIKAILDKKTILEFTLLEGRNRQIRKMCEQVGIRIASLKRVAIGDVRLSGLKSEMWRNLSKIELDRLKKTFDF